MAHRMKRFYLPCMKGLEMSWNISCFANGRLKNDETTAVVPRMFFCAGQNITGYRAKLWKRIRKNDPDMDYYLNSTNIQGRIKELSNVMGCTFEQATELVRRDSPLGVKDSNALFKSIELLLSYKFSAVDIISNPAVLHRTYTVLKQRLETLTRLKDPPNERSLSLLTKSNRAFKTYVDNRDEEDELLSKFSTRQHFIMDLLECDEDEVKQMMEDYDLSSLSPVLLKSKVDAFRRYQIPTSVIRRRMYVLYNLSIPVIESRLQILRDNDLLDHPYVGLAYMSRKSPDFEECLSALKENKQALEGCSDKTDYLIFRLKCPYKIADGLANSTQLRTVSEAKLKKMLDFFLDEMKMTSGFVVSNMYLMAYSLERMKSRWDFISTTSSNKPRCIPRLLSMSDADFQKFMKTAPLS